MIAVMHTLAEHLTGCTKFVKHLAENPNKTYKILKLNIPPLKKKIVILGKGMPKTSLDAEGKVRCLSIGYKIGYFRRFVWCNGNTKNIWKFDN